MNMTSSPVMLDVDTGVDDAAAIALALGLGVNLVGVSAVAGNVPVDLAVDNSLRVLSLLGGEDIPVFRGASRPLVVPYQDASHVHGGNGLGNAEVPAPVIEEAEMSGPEAITTLAETYAGDFTLVTVGPLTNLAIALSLRPQITEQVSRLVIMGGAYFNPGNVTPHAEYNIYVDPDAAIQVFAAPWKDITAVGLDVTHQTAITQKMWDAIPEDATGAAWLIRAISERTFVERVRSGFFLHDPLALAVAVDPSLVSGDMFSVTVDTDPETQGKTNAEPGGNVRVASTVRSEDFLRRFCDATGIPYVEDIEGLANAE